MRICRFVPRAQFVIFHLPFVICHLSLANSFSPSQLRRMSPWFHFRARADFQSEQDLQGKLGLPRGAAVSGRKARALDDAEILSAHDPAGLPEVGVIEEIEELRAELQARRFTNLRGLDEREIHVVEPGTGHDVASDIAEDRRTRTTRAAGSTERRLVEPGRRM